MSPSLFSMLLVFWFPGPTIQGNVRLSGSGEPLAGVWVELDGGAVGTRSDSLGGYTLQDVTPGLHRLRFSRLGCTPLTVDVLAPEEGNVRLDVELGPQPIALSEVDVLGVGRSASVDSGSTPFGAFSEIGFQRLTMATLRTVSVSGETDVFKGLAGSPGIPSVEFSATLHMRGGSGDQNLTMIGGVPIYSPYHPTDVLTAINADALSSVESHTAVPPARYGGRLAGVIDLQPREANRLAVEWSGSVGPSAVGLTVDGPLPVRLGGFLLSARRSYRDLFGRSSGDAAIGFGDRFGDVTFDLPRGTIQLYAFQSENHLAFDGLVDAPGGAEPGTGLGASVSPRNRFGWTSQTTAIVWRDTVGHSRWETKAWRATLQSAVDWSMMGNPALLTSRFEHIGIAGSVARSSAANELGLGVSVERLSTRYDLSPAGNLGFDKSVPPRVGLRSARAIAAAFVEDRWRSASHWAVSAGLRGNLVEGGLMHLEPRLSVRFAPSAALALSVGYARTHQYSQSLRNEESVLDAMFGADLPAVAGASGIPVARADQVTGALELQWGERTRLLVDMYVKQLNGLVLVAPQTAQPFATTGAAVGRGESQGGNAVFEHSGERLGFRVAYALDVVVRRTNQLTYRPSFAPSHTLTVTAGYRIGSFATLGLGLRGAAGRRSTPIVDGFQGHSYDPLRGIGDYAGSPQRWFGPVDGARLPPYVRLDVSARRDWHPAWLGKTGKLSTFTAVENVLGRQNGFALVGDPAQRNVVPMLPRTLTFGVEWRR